MLAEGQVRYFRNGKAVFILGKRFTKGTRKGMWPMLGPGNSLPWGEAWTADAIEKLTRPHWFQPGVCVAHPFTNGAYQHFRPVLAVGSKLMCEGSGLSEYQFRYQREPGELRRFEEPETSAPEPW